MDTVLVVEDSRPMQRTLQRLFEADGLAVEIADDGIIGLESFRRQTPSVVVLDLKLRGVQDAAGLCHPCRDWPRHVAAERECSNSEARGSDRHVQVAAIAPL